MNRWTVLAATAMFCVLIAVGCSNGGSNPIAPTSGDLTGATAVSDGKSQTHLWGYYDVYIDVPNKTVEAVPNRDVQFAANVVTFLNGNPANLAFNIIGTPASATEVDVDIDVAISHPFPGMHMYDGYDVRGIFLGDGSRGLKYKSALKYAEYGASDQVMYDYDLTDPDTHDGVFGNPDGYTRWWNPSEFAAPGILGYTPGIFASGGYTPTAKVNPYKYFADGLTAEDDLWEFLTTTADNGIFAAGSKNTRNYYLRFPMPTPGVKYAYAVVANWIDETTHPANATEAMALDAQVTPDIWYTDATHKGGSLKLDISVFNWFAAPVYTLYVESDVLSALHTATPAEMTPTGGGDNYSTYHLDIPADNITGTDGNEFWVIVEEQQYDYKNSFNVPNSCGNDKLAAFFRYDLFVSPTSYNAPPVADLETPDAGIGWTGQGIPVEFDATGSTDPDAGDVLTFTWDFNNDGTYGDAKDGGTDAEPIKKFTTAPTGNQVSVKVTDTAGAFDTASAPVSFTWFTVPKNKVITLTSQYDYIYDSCVDPTTGDWLCMVYDGYYGQYHYIRRYHMSDGYATFSTININSTNWPSYYYWDSPYTIDCDQNGIWSVGSGYPEYNGYTGQNGIRTSSFDTTDTFIASKFEPLPAYWYTYYNQGDICAMGDNNGSRANDIVDVFAWCTTWTSWYADMYTWCSGRQDTGYTTSWSSTYHNTGTGIAGPNDLDMQVYKAVEGDPDGDYIWFLKAGYVYNGYSNTPDFRAGKFDVSGTSVGSTAAVVINSGGGQTTADTGWGYDAYDMTIGEQGTVYVLDQWGTSYPQYTMRVKAFSETDGSSLGGADVSTTIYYPYGYMSAVDGTDKRDFLTVHTASTYNWPYTWYLWVMTDVETPPA